MTPRKAIGLHLLERGFKRSELRDTTLEAYDSFHLDSSKLRVSVMANVYEARIEIYATHDKDPVDAYADFVAIDFTDPLLFEHITKIISAKIR